MIGSLVLAAALNTSAPIVDVHTTSTVARADLSDHLNVYRCKTRPRFFPMKDRYSVGDIIKTKYFCGNEQFMFYIHIVNPDHNRGH